jgi:hypothetical protein
MATELYPSLARNIHPTGETTMIVDIVIGTGLLIAGFIAGVLVMAHNRKHAESVDKAADALGDKLADVVNKAKSDLGK